MQSKVRIPFYVFFDVNTIDPAKIIDATQSNLIRSLYSTLVYFDTDGKIRAGAAENFEVKDNILRFYIRDSLITSDGDKITAEDVFLSFKRLLVLNKNTHGRLDNFLKCDYLPKTMDDRCEGIQFKGNTFEIALKSSKFVPFFLPMLAGPDFSILPRKSVNYSGDLKITDFKNTSGPYFIQSCDKEKITFKINKGHYLIDDRNPETIEFIQNVGPNRNKKFIDGQFDVIPTFAVLTSKDLKSFGDLGDYNLHQTLPIHLIKVGFSSQGRKHLSREERLSIGLALRKAFLKEFKEHIEFLETNEYFGVVGEGALTTDQLQKINSSMLEAEGKLDREITADLVITWPDKAASIIQSLQNFKFKKLKNLSEVSSEDAPDAFVVDIDSGGFDNVSLLSYLQSIGELGMTDEEFKTWLDKYFGLSDAHLRMEMFRDLHYKMLYQAEVVPIAVMPYYAIARKPWKIEAYQMFAGSPFWTIKHE